jgi:hypothetical protein
VLLEASFLYFTVIPIRDDTQQRLTVAISLRVWGGGPLFYEKTRYTVVVRNLVPFTEPGAVWIEDLY